MSVSYGDGDKEITIQKLMEDVVGVPANPRITLRGWQVSGVICVLLWMILWVQTQNLMPIEYHMLFGISSSVCCFGISAIIASSIFGLFKRPWRAAFQIALRSFLVALVANMFVIVMAIAAAFEAS